MELIKKINALVKEDAAGGAVGAGGMAGGMAMPLFSVLVKRTKPQADKEETFVGDEEETSKATKKKSLKEQYAKLVEFSQDGEGQGNTYGGNKTFDTAGVIAKLKGLESREEQDHRDTVTFGLEDDERGLVRVVVKHEQAEDFEKALQAFLADVEEDEAPPEIAEVLFKLKDRFDIVDVQWPEVQEDEEENVDLQGADGEVPPEGDMEGMDDVDAELPADTGDDEDAKSLLNKVIDMMMADAEARTADARAREAEAKTKEADSIARRASLKVKQEEQLLDMEQYNKAKKEEEREVKRLAQLSKFRSEMGHDNDDDFEVTEKRSLSVDQEDEEVPMPQPRVRSAPVQHTPKKVPPIRGKVHPHEIASYILNRVK